MKQKDYTKHMSIAVQIPIYEGIKEVAEEHEISMTKAINAILKGYLRSREVRKQREEKNG